LFPVVAALLLLVAAAPVQAQWFDYYNTNSEIGTIGDLADSKIKSPVNKVYRLNFGASPLFAGSELYDPPSFKPYIFPLPDFGSTNEYFGVSFEEYLNKVAGSYGLSLDTYLFQFQYQNEYTATYGYVPQLSEVIQVHQNDFVAGGGFLPFGDPTIPQKPQDDPNEFEPLDPIFRPLPTGDDTTETESDINNDANLASEIVGGGTVNIDESGTVTLDGNLLVGDSASQSAASVAVVPEPATLGLLTLGTGLLLGRRRR
jgi:hypothetical protein